VDYAIMEKADNIYTIPSDIGWSDLGTWNSLYSYRDKDENGNVTTGKVILKDTKDCFIRTKDGKLTVIKGLEDFIVVDEGDILLVYPKKLEQEIKGVVGAYKKDLPEYF
jgi:mannose-1-phosphate guanylyltransferase